MKVFLATTLAAMLAITPLMAADHDPVKRLDDAATVLSEVMSAPDNRIPADLLTNAHCIVIVPALKTAAFVRGRKIREGVSCRAGTGGAGWSAPAALRIEGGSVGFQIGGSSTDLIMLVMNERGADKLLASKFTLGGEAIGGGRSRRPDGDGADRRPDARRHPVVVAVAGPLRGCGARRSDPARGSGRQRRRCTARRSRTARS